MRIASSSSANGHHRHDRSEDLLLRDAMLVAHVGEDRRLEEVAARQVLRAARRRWRASRPPASRRRCTPRSSARRSARITGPEHGRRDRPGRRPSPCPATKPTIFCDEVVVDRAAARARASTSRSPGRRGRSPARRRPSPSCRAVGVEVDADRLAAELEVDALQRLRRRLHDLLAGADAAGEADLVDARDRTPAPRRSRSTAR